jgi:DNA mismatch endonuclease (patch repair protein)
LYAAGLRYRVGLKVPGLPRRTIDIAFPKVKIAVFVDGCFWHGCPRHVTWPVANADWWVRKIEANRRRDAATTAHLESLGWTVLRVWEHGVDESAAAVIGETVRSATASPCSRRDSSVPARLTPRDLGAG